MMDDIEKLIQIIDNSDNIVFFGGAGVSTESGIKDFRGRNGIYTELKNEDPLMSPEYLLSSTCLYREPEKFYENYRKNLNCTSAKPNITHKYLKVLEDRGKLTAIVTQNIDGLHQKAGSSKVYEIHGTMNTCHCTKCDKEFPGGIVFETEGIPKCDACGEMIRPDVVLYGEMLTNAYSYASYYILNAEVLIVAGTSLVVAPASGMVNLYQGSHLIIINDAETPYDEKAEIVIHKPLGEVFSVLMEYIK